MAIGSGVRATERRSGGRRFAPTRSTIAALLLMLCAGLVACGGKKQVTPAAPAVGRPSAASPVAGGAAAPGSPPLGGTPGSAATGASSPGATATGASSPGAPTATAQTAAGTPAPLSASRVETVKTVYDILLDRYYRPLKSNDLLSNAWHGASQAASRGSGQVNAPKLSGDRAADWRAFSDQYAQLFAKAGGTPGTDLAFGAVQAMADGLHDDHTYFLNPADNKQRQADDSGGATFVGVGISLSGRAPYTVQSVVPGGPAEKAGIQTGDTLTAVDGQSVAGLSLQDLSDRLRGSTAGSTVRVTVSRNGATQDLSVTRAQIGQPAIEYRTLSDGVGYVALHNFADAYARFADGKNIAETLDAALQSFEKAGVKGWIFDVRGNPGGSEQTLAEVAGRFLPDGIVLDSTDRDGQTTHAPVDGHLFAVQRPLAVLIDGQSGSASELFAATMKEYGRARLVGQRTAGAVNGALETELPDGAAFQYTVVEGRTGKNHTLLDGVGVSPDDTVSGDQGAAAILAGRTDGQFDHATQWVLDQAKKQPLLNLTPPPKADTLAAADVRAKLTPLAATMSDVPNGPARARYGDLTLTYPNELAIGIATDSSDPAALEQSIRNRHWQGGLQQFFGSGAPPPYTIEVDLYADAAGAGNAVRTNDYSTGLKAAPAPAKLGDETVAYTGYDAAGGSTEIVWRRGRVVYTVMYSADSGQPSPAAALAVASAIDARAAKAPQP
ncbi:MAG: S41 family peptidase [Dehalococcoidia bacterium]